MSVFNSGVIFGIIFGVLVLAIALCNRKRRGEGCLQEYDERQLQARASAYSTAFSTVIILIAMDGLLKMAGIIWYEEPFGEFAILMIAMIVFAFKAIMSDAFLGNNEKLNGRGFKLLYLAVGIGQLSIVLSSLDEMVVAGLVTIHAISLITGITFLSVAITMIVHERKQKAEEEE